MIMKLKVICYDNPPTLAPRVMRHLFFSFFIAVAALTARSAAAAEREPAPVTDWVFLTVQQDASWSSGEDPCTPANQQTSYVSCFRANGTQYLGTPRASDRASLAPGFTLATTRVALHYAHFVLPRLSLGGRAGLVVNGGGPRALGRDVRPFFPLHLELQAAWWPLAPRRGRGVGAFLFAGGGLAQIDTRSMTRVREDLSAPPAPSQLDNPPEQRLDVYQRSGIGFASVGAGAAGPLSERMLWRAAVQGMTSFPAPGLTLGLELGIGFDLSPSSARAP